MALTRTNVSSSLIVLAFSLLALAPAALAVDGVIEINQTKALAGGVGAKRRPVHRVSVGAVTGTTKAPASASRRSRYCALIGYKRAASAASA